MKAKPSPVRDTQDPSTEDSRLRLPKGTPLRGRETLPLDGSTSTLLSRSLAWLGILGLNVEGSKKVARSGPVAPTASFGVDHKMTMRAIRKYGCSILLDDAFAEAGIVSASATLGPASE